MNERASQAVGQSAVRGLGQVASFGAVAGLPRGVEPSGPVGVAQKELVSALVELQKSVDELGEKLEPVMTPMSAMAPENRGPESPVPIASPMVDVFRELRDRVEQIHGKVNELRRRVEL